MINLHRNLDPKQPVQFSSVESLRKAVVSNPHKYDGLCFFEDQFEDEVGVELVYVDGYESWEVCTSDGNESESFDSIEDAVEAFVLELENLWSDW